MRCCRRGGRFFTSLPSCWPRCRLAGQGAPPAAPLRLVTADGSASLPTILNGDTELIAFDDLSSIFGVVREDAVARAFTVGYKGKTIVLSQNQALASISGRLVSLPAPRAAEQPMVRAR